MLARGKLLVIVRAGPRCRGRVRLVQGKRGSNSTTGRRLPGCHLVHCHLYSGPSETEVTRLEVR